MLRGYKGKVAVITGAAGGLGRALAAGLAARECNLALVDIEKENLASAAAEIARPGIVVTEHCADVAAEEAIYHVTDEVLSAHKTVHLLINNAAISASAAFKNTDAALFEKIVQVNFLGAVRACRSFLPFLREPEAQILNVASCFAWAGYPRKTAYASSKAALRAFSESLRLELKDSGVGVTILYPGPLPTSLVRSGFHDSKQRGDREDLFLRRHGLSLERVVRECFDRLPSDPGRIVIGLDYRLLDMLARVSPGLASRAIASMAVRIGF